MQLVPSAARMALPLVSSRLVSSCIASHRLASSRICLCIALHRLSKIVPSSPRLVHLLVLGAGGLRFTACLCLYRLVMLKFSCIRYVQNQRSLLGEKTARLLWSPASAEPSAVRLGSAQLTSRFCR
ncbi:uncharacterized protein TrAFT101_010258 [Trichoderma asperellum]|uniref:uncharacterized protein n=1 Tax=Trichoderma asperellum TaxID=101201 RepID=UPI00332A3611|nr:hypothetical protein TrAFT101_010258 [Trichoderma asperellum]